MRILLVSDTHGDLEAWNKCLSICEDVDYIIHAGDVLYHGPRNIIKDSYNPAKLAKTINALETPIFIARGNCDAEVDEMVLNFPIHSSPLFCRIEGLNIVVDHGHKKSDEDLLKLADKFKANLLVSGHTHQRFLKKIPDLVIVNPGSISLPKSDDKISSFAILEENKISLINLEDGEVLEEVNI